MIEGLTYNNIIDIVYNIVNSEISEISYFVSNLKIIKRCTCIKLKSIRRLEKVILYCV